MGAVGRGLGAGDLKQVGGPLRIQVKQSAARRWHADDSPPPRLENEQPYPCSCNDRDRQCYLKRTLASAVDAVHPTDE